MTSVVRSNSKDNPFDFVESMSDASSSGGDSRSISSCYNSRGGETTDAGRASTAINKQQNDGRSRTALASQETRAVRKLKILVMATLTFSLIVVAYAAYHKTYTLEKDQFVDRYNRDANKVAEALGQNLHRTLLAADVFAASIVSVTNRTNQTWPFILVPDFAVQAEKIRSLSQAVLVNLYQVVDIDQRTEWENFTAMTGKGWVDESIAVIENYDGMDWPIIWNYTLWDVIHSYDEFDKENPGVDGINTSGPWIPMWQSQPTIAHQPPYNWYVRIASCNDN
jgi:hypothetical protein